ncbi:hypothetical protein LO762_26670 [Actinocorallia sp. API 0066]|uniref:hypothetical protein n=1 Tax=Actinocorallia sp. API 0066 TaxID=2896846 RepID=UPI001E2ECBE4|nr:hypothetical protein [Actinocorallia sp. API 0066]MCD0452739.1 hypothetical protein [Actinocorallia sp. API 0066]
MSAWADAIDRVNVFADRLEKTPSSHTVVWARAARETAGVYAVLWRRIEVDRPGPLAGAVDALARSAQHRRRGVGDAYHRPLCGAARVVQAAVPRITGRAHQAWIALVKALVRLVGVILEANRAQGQALRAVQLADARQAQLDRVLRRGVQPRPQARPAAHGMTDWEMDHVANAIRLLNEIHPQELLRRGDSTRSKAPRPNPMLSPERGFGL